MKTNKNQKSDWMRPEVKMLNIKRDTFSGTGTQEESQGNSPNTKRPRVKV